LRRAASSSVEVRITQFAIVRQDEIPSIEAVFTAIGDEVARQPEAVFARMCQQMAATAAIDADDRRLRF
jgi:hypothetical protein